ncbi:hypothetical protein LTR36_010750 [Oleoguttula mirabilis]|uniref:Uncharacterized protein n=1 Tax=Oleoguttula mirabilis TaxID=1507867 RepID=A0AAV9JRF3_9PEZI|nr:hypothetical protein LTR36_010750 [Oleoguttula mirabilis]
MPRREHTTEGQWRLFLKIARLIAMAQREPLLKEDSHVALEVYRDAIALTRQWLPVVERGLQDHGMLGSSGEPSTTPVDAGMRPNDTIAKKGFLSLLGRVAKTGFGGSKKGEEHDGSGKWTGVLTKELHEVVVMFVEDAEREIRRLERLLEGNIGPPSQRDQSTVESDRVRDDGRRVRFGDQRLTIADLEKLEVEFKVEQQDISAWLA